MIFPPHRWRVLFLQCLQGSSWFASVVYLTTDIWYIYLSCSCFNVQLHHCLHVHARHLRRRFNSSFNSELIGCNWDTEWRNSFKWDILATVVYFVVLIISHLNGLHIEGVIF